MEVKMGNEHLKFSRRIAVMREGTQTDVMDVATRLLAAVRQLRVDTDGPVGPSYDYQLTDDARQTDQSSRQYRFSLGGYEATQQSTGRLLFNSRLGSKASIVNYCTLKNERYFEANSL